MTDLDLPHFVTFQHNLMKLICTCSAFHQSMDSMFLSFILGNKQKSPEFELLGHLLCR